jgi:hypothetical protein
MNGRMKKGITAGLLVAGAFAGAGCCGSYNDLVDPCYPQRYNCMSRAEVDAPLAAQARNGLILDQTLFVHHFAAGSENLLPGGQALLARVARRRPFPEPEVFIQAAQAPYDFEYTTGKEDEALGRQQELNEKRREATLAFLRRVRPDVPFTVTIHKPSSIGMSAREATTAVQQLRGSATGAFQTNIGGSTGTGGGTGGGGGGGGGGGQQ